MKSLFARSTRRFLVVVSLLALMAGILQPLGATRAGELLDSPERHGLAIAMDQRCDHRLGAERDRDGDHPALHDRSQ